MKTYRLDGHTPIPCSTLEWGQWMEEANRVVAQEQVGQLWVSTVFLGLDHRYGDGPPLLFETMVFDTNDQEILYQEDLVMCRYSTWDEALEGHKAMVAMASPHMLKSADEPTNNDQSQPSS